MRLVISFGLTTEKEVVWHRDLIDLPNSLGFKAKMGMGYVQWVWPNYKLSVSLLSIITLSFNMDMPSF